MQAGHFISRRHNATLFDEENTNAQCYYCNVIERGNIGEYTFRLKEKLGNERFDALLAKGRTTKQFDVKELQALEAHYKKLNETNGNL